MLPRVPPHVPACGITGRFNTRPSSVLGSTRPSTSPSSAHLVSIQPDGLPRGVAVTVMLSTPPHAQRRRRMLSAAAAGSAPSPLVLLPAPPSPASTDTEYPQLHFRTAVSGKSGQLAHRRTAQGARRQPLRSARRHRSSRASSVCQTGQSGCGGGG